jgi:hypothetical protein
MHNYTGRLRSHNRRCRVPECLGRNKFLDLCGDGPTPAPVEDRADRLVMMLELNGEWGACPVLVLIPLIRLPTGTLEDLVTGVSPFSYLSLPPAGYRPPSSFK